MAEQDQFEDRFETISDDYFTNISYTVSSKTTPTDKHFEILKKKFGHENFRPLQWKIIGSILNDKRDNCAIMTTGYGKSLCYQFPAIFTGGVTFVISPLISLMQDQILAMKAADIPSCLLGMANTQQSQTITDIFEGKYSLVYLTPEFCVGQSGSDMLRNAYEKLAVCLIAVDEAHCVSSWGHDFRHSYRSLNVLKIFMPTVPILAVTATATPKVEQDIIKVLNLQNPQMSHSGFDRPNFYFAVHEQKSVYKDLKTYMVKKDDRWQFEGPTIIYTISRKKAEQVSAILQMKDLKSQPYHAGLNLSRRKSVHEDFVKDNLDIVVATIAFGMGIDKPDVRLVIHYGMPQTIESYYQEAGRAGRDGRPAKCIMFYGKKDKSIYRLIWRKSKCSQAQMTRKTKQLDLVFDYINTECRRNFILSYFENEKVNRSKQTNCCDNCCKPLGDVSCTMYNDVGDDGNFDFTESMKKLLSVVKLLRGKFGLGIYADFLIGRRCGKTWVEGFYKNELFGCGKDKKADWWKEIGSLGLIKKYLQKIRLPGNGFIKLIDISKLGENFLNSMQRLVEVPSEQICQLLGLKDNIWIGKTDLAPLRCNSATLGLGDIELYHKLVDKRKALAIQQDCSRYMIATDEALRQLATRKPHSLIELKNDVYDCFTETKINNFGQDFIDLINGNSSTILQSDQKKLAIRQILDRRPLPGTKHLTSQLISVKMYLRGDTVENIAVKRNLTVGTIYFHLVNGIRAGYPIKLQHFGVTNESLHSILETAEQQDTKFSILTNVKTNCPIPVTFEQVKAVRAFKEVRDHLNKLGLPYEDFEDFGNVEFSKNDENDDLGMFIEHLKNEIEQNESESLRAVNRTEENQEFFDGDDDDCITEACDILERSLNNSDSQNVEIRQPENKKIKMDFSDNDLELLDLLDSCPKSVIKSSTSVLNSPPRSTKLCGGYQDEKSTLDSLKRGTATCSYGLKSGATQSLIGSCVVEKTRLAQVESATNRGTQISVYSANTSQIGTTTKQTITSTISSSTNKKSEEMELSITDDEYSLLLDCHVQSEGDTGIRPYSSVLDSPPRFKFSKKRNI